MKKRILLLLIAIAFSLSLIPGSFFSLSVDASLPSDIYLHQLEDYTCTLSSAAMMLRARMYLSNNELWSSITETSIRPIAWKEGAGLYYSWTYSISGNTMSVAYSNISGITISYLKQLLNNHPEGIVLYCGNLPHAVFLTDYEGDTFYCADPGYNSHVRLALSGSYLGLRYGSQANVLSNVTG